ncbi:MAG: hypothetical protein OEW00_08470 [candidate division Zixibacteria bacterium]|nr:hypothetical protein [candidate division Zixibacteria bacterium]
MLVYQLYHLVRADFLDRIRRSSFVVVIGLALFAGYLFVPPLSAPYTSFVVASHRGFYNSPWVGTLFGVTAATLLTLIGFYLVKNSIGRDYETRVGQVIATTPLGKVLYMAGKWLSNVLVLGVILGVLSVIAPLMQIVRAEVAHVDLMALWTPIWMMGFPALMFVGALAVLFESVPLLRGGLGNIIYFFIWGPFLIGSSTQQFVMGGKPAFTFDFAGMARIVYDIKQQLIDAGADISKGIFGVIGPVDASNVTRFTWDGIQWTPEIILERLLWVALGVIPVMIAAAVFNRFDPAGGAILARRGEAPLRRLARLIRLPGSAVRTGDKEEREAAALPAGRRAVELTPLDKRTQHTRFLSIVRMELTLMVKGHGWWWYVGAIGLIVATPLVPLEKAAQILFAAAWLWPILVWSKMGNLELRHQTHQIVFSAPYPLRRQLPATWVAGVAIAAVLAAGFMMRTLLAGHWQYLYAPLIGALFVPTLALALGVWTNGSRMFEVVYLLLWYISVQGGTTVFDYRGATVEAVAAGVPFYYLAATIGLMLLAVLGRHKQMRLQ